MTAHNFMARIASRCSMLRLFQPLVSSVGLILCATVIGQNHTSAGYAAPQAEAGKSAASDEAAKVITAETLQGQEACTTPAQPAKDVTPEDALRRAFLRRIAGRWNFAYVRKGNQRWWPDHGSAKPTSQIHYLFGPSELSIESRPEFNPPSITGRFEYGSVRKVYADLFDLALYKPCEPGTQEVKRFKLSADGKTLEIAADADRDPEPTVQVLEFVDANWPKRHKPGPKH